MLLETRIISFQYTTRIDLQTDPVDDQKKTFDLPKLNSRGEEGKGNFGHNLGCEISSR